MIAAIFTGLALFALVAVYGLHVWREVRLAQANSSLELAKVIRGGGSQEQHILDALERSTAAMERFIRSGAKPSLHVVDTDGGPDAA